MRHQPPKLIGLLGFAGSGKSTVAQILSSQQHGFVPFKFASVLKGMLEVLGLSQDEIDGDLKTVPCEKLCGRSPRYAMQTLGTEWGRHLIHPNLWVNTFSREVSATLADGASVVCDDVRFVNEAEAIKKLGGKLCRVLRPNAPLGCESEHKSETEQLGIKVDFYVLNNATKDEIDIQVKQILQLWDEEANANV